MIVVIKVCARFVASEICLLVIFFSISSRISRALDILIPEMLNQAWAARRDANGVGTLHGYIGAGRTASGLRYSTVEEPERYDAPQPTGAVLFADSSFRSFLWGLNLNPIRFMQSLPPQLGVTAASP